MVRDRFHYFGSFEGLRERSTSVITSALVPADQREEAATSDGDQYFFKTDFRFNAAHAMTARYRADDRIVDRQAASAGSTPGSAAPTPAGSTRTSSAASRRCCRTAR